MTEKAENKILSKFAVRTLAKAQEILANETFEEGEIKNLVDGPPAGGDIGIDKEGNYYHFLNDEWKPIKG